MNNKSIGLISLLFLLCFICVKNSYSENIKKEKNNCNLIDAYLTHLERLKYMPTLYMLEKMVHYESFVNTTKALNKEAGIPYANKIESIQVTSFLLIEMFSDNRLLSIEKFKEVCDYKKNEGELIIKANSLQYGESYDVIPLVFKNGFWKRGFYFTSGYSYLLGDTANEILSNKNDKSINNDLIKIDKNLNDELVKKLSRNKKNNNEQTR